MQVTSRTQGYDLVDESLFQHICESLFNTGVQYLTISRSDGQVRDSIGQLLQSRSGCFSTLRRLSESQLGHALTADTINFQCPTETLGIVRVNSRGGDRINQRQLIVQGLPAKACSLFFDLRANLWIGLRHLRQTFDQSLVVEHRAAYKQRNFASRGDLGHGLQSITTKIRRRIALRRVENIDQAVWEFGQ